ncbi:MAG: sugar-binding protein [Actinomycetota bacterium]|nr:sugar-binding protein [Actinomycetota bacterium]
MKKENYTSHTDVNGTFYSCWDDENFYLAIQVIDDVFSQNYTGDQLNNGDSVVIVIDTDLAGDLQTQFLNNDDYQIEFSPGSFGQIPPEAFMRWPSNAAPQNTEISSARLSNGYIIEASIPWNSFPNYTPTDEDILGFTVSILDTDNLESTELVISSSNQFDFNNVFTLGNLVLIDAGDLLEEEQQEGSEHEEE